jgi:hypothetical protein
VDLGRESISVSIDSVVVEGRDADALMPSIGELEQKLSASLRDRAEMQARPLGETGVSLSPLLPDGEREVVMPLMEALREAVAGEEG